MIYVKEGHFKFQFEFEFAPSKPACNKLRWIHFKMLMHLSFIYITEKFKITSFIVNSEIGAKFKMFFRQLISFELCMRFLHPTFSFLHGRKQTHPEP